MNTQVMVYICIYLYVYIYVYIMLCLLNKHDKCNVSKLAVTIKIQYLCVLKVHRIKTAKQNHPKQFTEVQIYSTNLLFKRVQIKKQQNRDINALLKGVGLAKGALWVDNSKALDKDQYLLVQQYNKVTIQSSYNLDYT